MSDDFDENNNYSISAYAIAVKNGFTGTEAEWIESLKGPTGDKGDAGSIGADTLVFTYENGYLYYSVEGG